MATYHQNFMAKTQMQKEKPPRYCIAQDFDHLPPLTVTSERLEKAHNEIFGGENDEIRAVSPSAFTNSKWSKLFEQFYRERIVYVRNLNVLLLRFQYDYEVDLDRIKSEAALLNWTLHLCDKTWMTTERIHFFIETVAAIKKFDVHRHA
jgi:hypothetical protein